jgi:hypothetical protein
MGSQAAAAFSRSFYLRVKRARMIGHTNPAAKNARKTAPRHNHNAFASWNVPPESGLKTNKTIEISESHTISKTT